MPSKRLVLGDLTSQLGLRAFYTKKGTDFKANPAVAQLWDRLTELCKVHYLKAMEFIPRCPDIHDAQAKLLKEHGPAIWSADDSRPWLMKPGEGSTSSPYERDLYWHNLSDQKFIKETFLKLIIEKILRWRKDHIRTARAASDNLFDPTYSSSPASTNTRAAHADSAAHLECFSANREDHLDASLLSQSVWMGDYDEEGLSVNGPTWDEVCKNYFENTTGGSECFGAEPHAFDETPAVATRYLQCAACLSTGRQPCERINVEVSELEHKDPDTQTQMTKNIWTFKCSLKGRDVYACLKELPEREWRRLKSDAPLWSFWKLNGGYTTNWFLTPVSENATTPILQSDIVQHGPDKGKRKRQDSPQREAESTNTSKRATRSSNSGRQMARKTAFNAINKHGGPALPKAVRSTESPLFVQQTGPSGGCQQSYDSLYDTTPAPQKKTQTSASASATSFFQQYTRPPYSNAERSKATIPGSTANTDDATATTQANAFAAPTKHTGPTLPAEPEHEPEHEAEAEPANQVAADTDDITAVEQVIQATPTPGPAPPSSQSPQPSPTETKPLPRSSTTMDPPPYTNRFPVWFKKAHNSGASKVVYLDDSMSVQQVFARIRNNLRRHIEEKKLLAIELRFQADGEALLAIDEDDADDWEMVLSMVKEAEKKEMYGSLELQ